MAFEWGLGGIGDIIGGLGNLLTGKTGAEASSAKSNAQLLKEQLLQSKFATQNILPLQKDLLGLELSSGQDTAQRQRSLDPVNAQALIGIMQRLKGGEPFGGMNALQRIQRFGQGGM